METEAASPREWDPDGAASLPWDFDGAASSRDREKF
jgi:hypothetical protein